MICRVRVTTAAFVNDNYYERMRESDHTSINRDLIEEQLQQLLSSRTFRNSHLLSSFLKHVVEKTLAGENNEIKEYTIATQVLKRPADFNPQVDAVVRIHAGRLRQLLSRYYEGEGINDTTLIEVPKGSYVPVFKTRISEEKEPLPAVASSRSMAGSNGDKPAGRKATVGVFPFQDLNPEHSNNDFNYTLGEQLSIDLARFQHLSVMSYLSMRNAALDNYVIGDLHKLYDVDYILSGSTRFTDDSIRINVQFLCAETGTLVWTQTYMRRYDSSQLYIFMEEIVEQVVNRIGDVDGLIVKNVVNGPLSYKKDVFGVYYAVYQSFAFKSRYDISSYHQARSALADALIVDSENELTLAMEGILLLDNHVLGFEKDRSDLEKSLQYVERALWINRDCQYAYAALAWHYLLSGRKNECIDIIERCLDANTKFLNIAGNMGFLLICLGKYQQGFRLLLRSMHLNPVAAWYVGAGLALYYYHIQDYTESLKWIERVPVSGFSLKSVIGIAASNKLNRERKDDILVVSKDNDETSLPENATGILHQYIYDSALRQSLAEGLSSGKK